jgi:hypothetical protein
MVDGLINWEFASENLGTVFQIALATGALGGAKDAPCGVATRVNRLTG